LSNILNLTIPIPPSINNDYMKPRAIIQKINGKNVPMAMLYEMAGAKTFKKNMVKLIKSEITKQDFKLDDNTHFVIVEYQWHFPKTNMDTNNYYKCFVDAITETVDSEGEGLIWKDDNISMMVDKDIYYNASNPHVDIKIYASPRIGVFKDRQDYDDFEVTYCQNCSKGKKIGQKGGCSIYKNAMESRIQDEIIENLKCKWECIAIKPLRK
jgi:Holliday junction resolvase RusA-like endonuclease